MIKHTLFNFHTKGMQFIWDEQFLNLTNFFGISCGQDDAYPECTGLFFLDSDIGRFDGRKLKITDIQFSENKLLASWSVNDILKIYMDIFLDASTGVISVTTKLENCDDNAHIIYSCMPRFPLQGADFQLYGQYSAWCAENQGHWTDVHAGNLVLTNSAGRSTESGTPFACIRHRTTGTGVCLHVLPIGDWIIRLRHIAGHLTSFTVLEAGLSDDSLRLCVQPHTTIILPELLLSPYTGSVETCGEQLQRYLLNRFPHQKLAEQVYNSWFFDFDVLEEDRLKSQVQIAKQIGCKTFVIDAGWFGRGVDWEHQVGNWNECTTRAFYGKMQEFSEYVRSNGMGMGLWMEPTRVCIGTDIYEKHPDWFMDTDAIVYDFGKPEVIDYLATELTRLVNTYHLTWMKIDYNSNMLRDNTGSNYYYYYLGERKLIEEIRKRNPQCSFEGCASGGMRADIENALLPYHGFFVSDTVNPLEVLRIRQNTVVRLLPAYTGSWLVVHECAFPRGTYTMHDRQARTKVFTCGDATWDRTVDVDLHFALCVNLMGEFGVSGDISSLSPDTLAQIKKAGDFYEAHREFMAYTVCHTLTSLESIDTIRGWVAMQYENVNGLGSVLYVFRLIDDATSLYVYPKNLREDTLYQMLCDGEVLESRTGQELTEQGICVTIESRNQAKLIELHPIN